MNLEATGKRTVRMTIALIVTLWGALIANAFPIAYVVNRTVAGGSVIGVVETDGTTGSALTAANILDWNLLLSDGQGNMANLTGPLSGNNSTAFITGQDVTATASVLVFNFNGTDQGYLLFEASFGSGSKYYCDSAGTQGVCDAGETV